MNQQFSGAAAIRAAMMVMGSTYLTYALGLLTSVLVARTLGPDDFGRYSYVVWLAGLLIAIGNNGLTTTAIRFVSESLGRESSEGARSVHGWLRRRQYACLAVIAVGFLALHRFLVPAGWDGHVSGFVIVALVAGMTKALFLFDVSVAKGYGRFGIEASSTVVMSIVNIAAVLVLLAIKAPLMAYMALFAAVGASYAFLSGLMLRRAGITPSHAALETSLLVRLRRHLMWTVVLTIANAFGNKSIETYLLNALVGPAEVGFFAIAAALTRGGIDLLSSGLTTVLMPMMAHAFGAGGRERANEIMGRSVRYFQFLGLLLAGVGALLAEVAVWLMYGERYAAVVPVLQIMIVVGGLTLAEGAFTALLATTDNQRMRAAYAGLSIGITALFAIVLIPRYGLTGAIAAHAASRVIVFSTMAFGITRVMQVRLPWRELLRQFVAAVIAMVLAALPLFLVPGIWTGVAAALIYAVVFTACSLALKAWRAPDVLHVAAFLERYPLLAGRPRDFLLRWAARLPAGE